VPRLRAVARLETSTMSDKKYTFHKIADYPAELSFNQQGIAVMEVNGKKICITLFRDEWFAFAYKCPHASGIMAEGYVDAVGNVVCPVHRYKFNLKNGRNTSGEGYYLKTYPVEVREESIWVGMPEGGLFGWL
jgi:nitrite reductase/ring-hydroxylating ferredoxin subunit